jgi:hypothetical protein
MGDHYEVNNPGVKLLKDSKTFQSLRLINIFSLRGGTTRDFDGKETLSALFWERCRLPEFRHCIDCAYFIQDCYEIRRPSLQRSAAPAGEWRPMNFGGMFLSQPLFLLFCSVFNETMDKDFRDAITIGNNSVVLEAASFYLYENELNNPQRSSLPSGTHCLDVVVLFQISNNALVNQIANPHGFFDDTLFRAVEKSAKINTVKFGLLKGNLEGFILFRYNGDVPGDAIRDLQLLLEGNAGWLGNIRPITVFLCTPVQEDLWEDNDRFMAAEFKVKT